MKWENILTKYDFYEFMKDRNECSDEFLKKLAVECSFALKSGYFPINELIHTMTYNVYNYCKGIVDSIPMLYVMDVINNVSYECMRRYAESTDSDETNRELDNETVTEQTSVITAKEATKLSTPTGTLTTHQYDQIVEEIEKEKIYETISYNAHSKCKSATIPNIFNYIGEIIRKITDVRIVNINDVNIIFNRIKHNLTDLGYSLDTVTQSSYYYFMGVSDDNDDYVTLDKTDLIIMWE